jgi:hypothetical protein
MNEMGCVHMKHEHGSMDWKEGQLVFFQQARYSYFSTSQMNKKTMAYIYYEQTKLSSHAYLL